MHCEESLFIESSGQDEKPRVLWSVFYDQTDTADLQLPDNSPEGVFVVPGPDLALDFDASIKLVSI